MEDVRHLRSRRSKAGRRVDLEDVLLGEFRDRESPPAHGVAGAAAGCRSGAVVRDPGRLVLSQRHSRPSRRREGGSRAAPPLLSGGTVSSLPAAGVSFSGRLRDECLNVHEFATLDEVRAVLEDSRDDYNDLRPHSSLGRLTQSGFAKKGQQTDPEAPGLQQLRVVRRADQYRNNAIADRS